MGSVETGTDHYRDGMLGKVAPPAGFYRVAASPPTQHAFSGRRSGRGHPGRFHALLVGTAFKQLDG